MGKNPYKGRPIPKGRIEWAIKHARSASEAARLLNVSRHTFRKYAEMYDLYSGITNKSGKGISKPKQRSGKYSLDSICNGEHPNYNVWKLGKRLLKAGYFKEECCQCKFDERRITDFRVPLIIDFIDGNKHSTIGNQLRCRFQHSNPEIPIGNRSDWDTKLSGDYLIYRTRHIIKRERYDMAHTMVKLGSYPK